MMLKVEQNDRFVPKYQFRDVSPIVGLAASYLPPADIGFARNAQIVNDAMLLLSKLEKMTIQIVPSARALGPQTLLIDGQNIVLPVPMGLNEVVANSEETTASITATVNQLTRLFREAGMIPPAMPPVPVTLTNFWEAHPHTPDGFGNYYDGDFRLEWIGDNGTGADYQAKICNSSFTPAGGSPIPTGANMRSVGLYDLVLNQTVTIAAGDLGVAKTVQGRSDTTPIVQELFTFRQGAA